MHRSTQRRDSLRQRVSEGRDRRQRRERRVYATLRVTRRTIALFAGLAMLGTVATVTQVASAENEPVSFLGSQNECAVETGELDVHVEEVGNGVRHYHYRGWGWRDWWQRWDGDGWGRGGHGHHHDHGDHGDDGDDGQGEPEPTTAPTQTPSEDCDDEGGQPSPPEETTGPEPTAGPTEDPGGEDPGGEDPGGEDPGGEDPGGEDPGGEDPGGEDPGGEDPGGEDPGGEDPGGEDPGENNGLPVNARDCTESDLEIHTGFQEGPRCVETAMGEVAAAEDNPTLLITAAPREVEANEPFTIQVSTRNLIRDRFLGAAAGGYYLESSFLTEEGLVHGHFHLGCFALPNPNEAPQPDVDPAFFAAAEDGGGGAEADFVNMEIPGLAEPGLYRCMAWAGDASHRVPMMEFARHAVAVDVVRINVT